MKGFFLSKVTVIIPFKDQIELLNKCVVSIKEKTTYKDFEIVCVNNNSTTKEAVDWRNEILKKYSNIRFFDLPIPFNFSRINNIAVNKWSDGDFLVFMNSDIEIITGDWLQQMVSWASKSNIGCVGARLYYPDNKVQHAGVDLNERGMPIHIDHNIDRYCEKNIKSKNKRMNAVTGALICVEKKKFIKTGGFDEELAVSYNDIDLCLELNDIGYQTIYLATCEAYHHESKTRGYENTPEKQERLKKEQIYLLKKHGLLVNKFKNNMPLNHRILFISATARNDRPYLDPSVRYRCFYPADELARDGYSVDIMSFEKFSESLINRYDVFIFHRPSWGDKLKNSVSKIKLNSNIAIASYDDLIFGEQYAAESSIVKSGRSTKTEALSIFSNNEKALKLFERFIVSTNELADKVRQISKGKIVVSYNALDRKTISSSNIINKTIPNNLSSRKVITYLSGTKSHDTDFAIVKNVLDRIKTERGNEVEICIVGPLDFQNSTGFTIIDHVDYDQLGKIISMAYLNIAPLEMNNFTKCKSGLKFFESAIYKVPSIVTPIPDMCRFEDCKGLVFATNDEEWYSSINKFLDDRLYRDNMANLSYEYAINNCKMKNQLTPYKQIIETV